MAVFAKLVGSRIKRREDPRLITGLSTYVDDIQLPGMLHVGILRSPHAHARIKRIDTTAARALPGVVSVVAGEDIKEAIGPVPMAAEVPGMRIPYHPVLALGKVRYVGEPVVAVVATDRYIARDALDLITVDYDPLEAVVDPEKALAPDAPRLYEEWSDNVVFAAAAPSEKIDQVFREADKVVKLRLIQQRLAPVPMEPRGVVARWDQGSRQLTVWSSTQMPHLLRTQLADMLRLPENHIRVIAPEVGGGFGAKVDVYGEEALIPYLAIKIGKPVKWIEGRRENLSTTIHGRGQIQYIEAAAKNDGTVLGLRVRVIVDVGAYLQIWTPLISDLTRMMMGGCYRIPHLAFEHVGVSTNKMALDAYRGAGRPEAAFLIERVMDAVAGECGLDPVEVRRKNFIPKEAFPYTTPTGTVYDSGNYEAALDKALEIVNYSQLRKEQVELRRQGRYLGIGLSSYVEISGIGPSSFFPLKLRAGGWESCTVRVEPTGKITVLTGISPHGQGQETSFAQLVADELGVDIEDVVVLHGDTAMVQYGVGTFGSRATAIGGPALLMSLEKIKAKARTIASHMMEVPPEGLDVGQGRVFLKTDPQKFISFQQVIDAAYGFKIPIPGIEPGLEATSFFEPPNSTFPFGTHVAVVEVEAETGKIDVRRYVAVDDCGRVLNPLLVDGQIHGGIAQGLAQALCEEVVYDDNGQLLSGTLMDYAVPKATMVPKMELDRTETPTSVNPLGVKGVGESGTIGSTPAVVNAVLDALAPLGITHLDMPLWPEKVWRAIQEAKAGRSLS